MRFLGFGVSSLGDWFWVGVVGCLGSPARLSSPVTLTLALSRRAGEGISFIAGEVLVGVWGDERALVGESVSLRRALCFLRSTAPGRSRTAPTGWG